MLHYLVKGIITEISILKQKQLHGYVWFIENI